MPLSESNVEVVVMVVSPNPAGENVPIGTAFFVTVRGPAPNYGFGYVVTAAHVVRSSPQSFVRMSLIHGSTEDIPIAEWTFHDDSETDVALAPIFLDQARYRFTAIAIESDVVESRPKPRLGETVYFIGLLSNIKSMHSENVPMVRSGTLGRLFQEDVKIKWPDQSIHTMTAHLIDCRSHQGFSGSPCYIQLEPRGRLDVAPTQDTFLLGLISGHLDELGVDQSIRNSGVGIVTPVEDIWHVLLQDEHVQQRRTQSDQYRLHHPEVLVTPTVDS
jgi:hypothetical protein